MIVAFRLSVEPTHYPKMHSNTKEWVRFNVGGQHFLTTKATLARDKNSFLYRICQDDPDLETDLVSVEKIKQ